MRFFNLLISLFRLQSAITASQWLQDLDVSRGEREFAHGKNDHYAGPNWPNRF
jgi:hypothetical protein